MRGLAGHGFGDLRRSNILRHDRADGGERRRRVEQVVHAFQLDGGMDGPPVNQEIGLMVADTGQRDIGRRLAPIGIGSSRLSTTVPVVASATRSSRRAVLSISPNRSS